MPASIRSRLGRSVALCALPAATLLALALVADLYAGAAIEWPDLAGIDHGVWWLSLAAAGSVCAGLVLARRTATLIDGSLQALAEAARRVAEGLPAALPPLPLREAAALAAALEQTAATLRERTAERDQATATVARLRHAAQELQHRASHDALTGLINRQRFDTVIQEHLAACDRGSERLTLLYVDVDGFKHVNDAHGHAVGDALLSLFAARLKGSVRDVEVVARLGGDEFGVIIDHATPAQALKTADGLIDRLSRPYRIGDRLVEVSASIGIATYPTSGTSAQLLLEAADAAMYLAKRGGKCRHHSSNFTPF